MTADFIGNKITDKMTGKPKSTDIAKDPEFVGIH